MRRRMFIAGLGAVAGWPVVALAQQGEPVRRIGVLTNGTDTEPLTTLMIELLRDELQKLGWIEGRNLRLDFRFGSGDANQTRVFAADLVQLAPDVLVAAYRVALVALQQQTKTIPIVFLGGGDPAENPVVTGIGGSYRRSVETAARSLGVQVDAIQVTNAAGMKAAIEAFAVEPNGGLLPSPGMSAVAPDELIRLAAQYRLPTVSGADSFAAAGGLMTYGSDTVELCRGAATYVGRLLRGAKVSDLPVQYPTKFHLAINLKTAKVLGLAVPPSILLRADEVIDE
jgi:putative tryptophan/tyrosine transport system substrate-binding protein